MTTRFIYFDLGNVLLTFSNEQMCRQMATVTGVPESLVRQTLYPHGDHTDPQWRFEAGQFAVDEYYEWFCEATRASPPRAALEQACADMFAPISPTHELADRLATSGYRLGLLSNTNAWHWRFVLDGRYPTLNRAFEIFITSFETKSMKPDQVIYQQAIRQAGCRPEEIFFTDDRAENVAGARAMGIDAVLFTSTEQLARDLSERGIAVS